MRLRTGALTAFVLLTACVAPAAEPHAGRVTIAFYRNWRFEKGDVPAGQDPALDDSAWRGLRVPHDWSIEGPFDSGHPAAGEGAFLPTGVGWYRKHFSAPEGLRGKRAFIEFDGVMANSDVWINGRHLGRRPSGYVGFCYDVTDHLLYGAERSNVVAVRADTSAQVASRWYTGSGIYRHVRLVYVDPVHVDYCGVFITTPVAEADRAAVRVEVTVRNHGPNATGFTVDTVLLDPDGKEAAVCRSSGRVDAGGVAPCVAEARLPRPVRWDCGSPRLYTAISRVRTDGGLTDEATTRFGVRKAEFRSETGFWLNDRGLKLKGVCLHHDGGAVGAAVPLGVWRQRLTRLRGLGVNSVRTSHNPVAPEFLDLCDELGILVMDEYLDCWTIGKRPHDYHTDFDQWWRRDVRDTLLRDRNHPCIVLYSAGNEIRDTAKPELARRVLAGLMEVYRESDPGRPVTQGLFRPNVSGDYDNGLADMLDVIGTNYRDQELLQAWRDKPGRKIVGTEQGHDRRTWLACRDHPQHAGQFLWVGADYLGESRRWPVTTFDSGLIDRTGRPHPRGFERQSWWSDQPMVKMFRRVAATEETPTDPGYETVEWTRRQVLFDDWTPEVSDPHSETVEVYSNCDTVELLLNGRSLGSKPLPSDAQPRQWRIEYEPGDLVAIGRNGGGQAAKHTLRTAGPAHHVALVSDLQSLSAGWDNVAYVEACVVDRDNTPTPGGARDIAFKVSGPGRVVAVDNASIVSHHDFQTDHCNTHQGRCVAIVRATGAPGEIRITAESPGLAPGTVPIGAEP